MSGAVQTKEVLRLNYDSQADTLSAKIFSSRVRFNKGERQQDDTVVLDVDNVAVGSVVKLAYANCSVRIKEIVLPNERLKRYGWVILEEVGEPGK